MLPQVLKTADFGTAVAALTIDGLGVCCFNPDSAEWEIAFPRMAGHRFIVKVKQVDQLGRIVRESEPTDVLDIRQIQIQVDNGSQAHLDRFPEGFYKAKPEFSRREDDESYDYRWVIDIAGYEVPHGPCQGLKTGQKVTIVTIPSALFYTKRVTTEAVVLAGATTNPEKDGMALGRMNEQIGAAIYTVKANGNGAGNGNGALEIKDKATGDAILTDFPMPLQPGLMYEVFLVNMDEEGVQDLGPAPEGDPEALGVVPPPAALETFSEFYVPGDFHRLYDVIKVTGTPHQIFAPPKSLLRARDGDCHAVGLGHDGGNIHTLMGLI